MADNLKMLGVLIARDRAGQTGVVWCADGRDLAVIDGRTEMDPDEMPEPGTMVWVKLAEGDGIRVCLLVRALKTRRDDLIEALREVMQLRPKSE